MANSVTYNSTTKETAITVDQGSTFEHTFTFTVDGDPYDITGFDARMQIRKTYGDTSVVWNGTLANNKLVLVTPASGVLKVVFSASDFTSTRFNNVNDDTLECVFDLELVDLASKIHKPARGTVTINREVTR